MENQQIKCAKRGWATIPEAVEARDHINGKKSSIDRNIVMRFYKCEKCNSYHLTSTSKKVYEKRIRCRTDKAYRQKSREQTFINVESKHWNEKFGIDDE